MERFSAFEDSALDARLERMRQTEGDLQERIEARRVQVDLDGQWLPSDPLYQRLASALRRLRNDLHEADEAHSRRAALRERERLVA